MNIEDSKDSCIQQTFVRVKKYHTHETHVYGHLNNVFDVLSMNYTDNSYTKLNSYNINHLGTMDYLLHT